MLLVAAMIGFATAVHTRSDALALAFVVGAAAAALLAAASTPDWLSLGGSLRKAGLARPRAGGSPRFFAMQADLYGALAFGQLQLVGSLGVSRVPASLPHARPAQLSTGQDEGANVLSRSHWLGYAFGAEWLLRAGRLNLPFGLRIPEHVMWVRAETQTDRESDQQHGMALAHTGSKWRGELTAIAGNYQINPDRYRERGYSAFAELSLSESLFVGASSLLTHASADLAQDVDASTLRQAHGLFARWAPSTLLTVSSEADVLLRSRRQAGYAALVQADVEIWSGLHLLFSSELLDTGYRRDPAWFLQRRRPGNGAPRFAAWVGAQRFFYSHLDLRIDALYRQPQTSERAAWRTVELCGATYGCGAELAASREPAGTGAWWLTLAVGVVALRVVRAWRSKPREL
jgi:hypothetical protein